MIVYSFSWSQYPSWARASYSRCVLLQKAQPAVSQSIAGHIIHCSMGLCKHGTPWQHVLILLFGCFASHLITVHSEKSLGPSPVHPAVRWLKVGIKAFCIFFFRLNIPNSFHLSSHLNYHSPHHLSGGLASLCQCLFVDSVATSNCGEPKPGCQD